jgi:aspartyl-tRNA(Asn)/glutamyl-tRNA(Gln) amidotransferase subunit A
MNASQPIHYFSAKQLTESYTKGELSPVEVTQAVLDRIETDGANYNAFSMLDADSALAAAHRSEERWRICQPFAVVAL